MEIDIELGCLEQGAINYHLGARRSAILGWELVAWWYEHEIKRYRLSFIQTTFATNHPMSIAKSRLVSYLAGLSAEATQSCTWELVKVEGGLQVLSEANSAKRCHILPGGAISFA